jgi:hypothetical protein
VLSKNRMRARMRSTPLHKLLSQFPGNMPCRHITRKFADVPQIYSRLACMRTAQAKGSATAQPKQQLRSQLK